MAKMTRLQFTAGLIAAALAFRQEQDAAAETARIRAIAGSGDENGSDDRDEEELWEWFQIHVEKHGITVDNGPELECIAGINTGEPSFTLRGQDILASMLTRHWIALYEGLAPDVNQSKLAGAEGIADKMEMYGKQKWPD
jgi:hypothetical protein